MSTLAPSLGRGCRAQRGGVGFLFCGEAASSLPSPIGKGVVSRKAVSPYRSLPHWGRGTAQRWIGCSRIMAYLRRSSPLIFHTARTLSGWLHSPSSPRGEGCDTEIPLPPSNLRPLLGTSFHRKEGVSTRAPSLGRGCRAQRGGVGFLLGRRSRHENPEP